MINVNCRWPPITAVPNQWVLVKEMNMDATGNRLAPTWKGPYQIWKIPGDQVLICTGNVDCKKWVNMDRVKPYQ